MEYFSKLAMRALSAKICGAVPTQSDFSTLIKFQMCSCAPLIQLTTIRNAYNTTAEGNSGHV